MLVDFCEPGWTYKMYFSVLSMFCFPSGLVKKNVSSCHQKISCDEVGRKICQGKKIKNPKIWEMVN